MHKRNLIIGLRFFFGVFTLTALITQAVRLSLVGVFDPVNYLSYFTNSSNLFAALILIVSSLYLAKKRLPTATDDVMRGAAVLYMAVTGAVYGVLLTDVELGLLMPWVNTVLHYVMPLFIILDWLYQPQKTKLTFRQTWVWLIFPAVWLIYSLIRGAVTGWYAYPFLNPTSDGGYATVITYCLAILVGFLGLGWLIMQLGNVLKRQLD